LQKIKHGVLKCNENQYVNEDGEIVDELNNSGGEEDQEIELVNGLLI
jgi:hypothetical protein